MSRSRAKRLLTQAAPHVGEAVVIIAPDYFATSLSVNSAREIEATMTIVNEGLKRLRRWHRAAQQREKCACSTA